MNTWEEELSMNHAVVKYKENECLLIKLSSYTTVSEVLTKACQKWKLAQNRHILKYSDEVLESNRNLGTSIPPNSTLHLIELDAERELTYEDELVYVSLQLEGTIFRKPFQKSDTFTKVLNELFDASTDGFLKKEVSKPKISKNCTGKWNSKCKFILNKNEKLVILLPSGAITLDQEDLDTTKLSDLSHDGHICLSFMIEDLEDVPLLDDDQDDGFQSDHNETDMQESSIIDESKISVTKIKKLLEKGINKSSTSNQVSFGPLQENELFERRGLVFKLNSDDNSSTDSNIQEDSTFIYTQSWIIVCFHDNLAIQASFAPHEHVHDIKDYVRKFLIKPNNDFELKLDPEGTPLDDKVSIFKSGLVPYAKLYFKQVYPGQTDEMDDQSQQMQMGEHQVNSIDTTFLKKVVTESIAVATAIHFSQPLTGITIESEVIRPKLEEITSSRY